MCFTVSIRPVPPGDNEKDKKSGDGGNEDENDDNEGAEEEDAKENDPEIEGTLF